MVPLQVRTEHVRDRRVCASRRSLCPAAVTESDVSCWCRWCGYGRRVRSSYIYSSPYSSPNHNSGLIIEAVPRDLTANALSAASGSRGHLFHGGTTGQVCLCQASDSPASRLYTACMLDCSVDSIHGGTKGEASACEWFKPIRIPASDPSRYDSHGPLNQRELNDDQGSEG